MIHILKVVYESLDMESKKSNASFNQELDVLLGGQQGFRSLRDKASSLLKPKVAISLRSRQLALFWPVPRHICNSTETFHYQLSMQLFSIRHQCSGPSQAPPMLLIPATGCIFYFQQGLHQLQAMQRDGLTEVLAFNDAVYTQIFHETSNVARSSHCPFIISFVLLGNGHVYHPYH